MDQLDAKFRSIDGHGYLFLSGAFSGVFSDINLGTASASNGLKVIVQEKSSDNTIVDETKFDSRSISVTGDGFYKISLPGDFTNVISEKQTKVNVFKVIAKEYSLSSQNDVGSQKFYHTTCEGVIEKDFLFQGFGDSSSTPIPPTDTTESKANDPIPVTPITPNSSKGLSGKMIAFIVGGILLLLAILVAIALFTGIFSKLMGMLGFDNNQNEQTTEVVEEPKEEPAAEEPKEEPVAEEPKEEPVAEEPKEEPVAENPAKEETQVQEPVNQSSVTQSTTTTTSNAVPCTITQASDGEIISNCTATKPNIAAFSSLAKEAFEKNRCDLGKRIFSSYGRRDANMAKTFASYYDVNSQMSSNCVNKDKTQAVYWYEKAVSLGDEESKSALSTLKE